MFSGSVNAGFVLALPFHHGELEPDYVGVSMGGGGLMCGVKIPLQDFALKMQGGAYARGGAYLRDTTVCVESAKISLPSKLSSAYLIVFLSMLHILPLTQCTCCN